MITQNKIELHCSRDELIDKLSLTGIQDDAPSDRRDSLGELLNYRMLNDQCTYMLQTIPTLVNKKIIK